MGISKNRGTPKSSILIGVSIVNHPFSGTPIFGNTQIEMILSTGVVHRKISSVSGNFSGKSQFSERFDKSSS